jgi:hypothetical protein
MPYSHSPVGLSTRDHKLAALFFEQIIEFGPISFVDPTPDRIKFKGPPPEIDVAQFKKMSRQGKALDPWALANKVVSGDLTDSNEMDAAYAEVRAIWHARAYSTAQQAFVPLVFSPRAFATISEGGQTDALQVLLGGLPFVDTSNAKWAQILDVRKDKRSLSALRDLRLFFASSYEGKSVDFVTDDVQRRLENFERARKKFGFDLLISSAKVLLDSKSILSIAGLALVASILGTPLAATVATLAGASLEIAKLTINITEQTHNFQSKAQEHELAYLIELKNKFP